VATGGILTGVAGVTNADVKLLQLYIDWRKAPPASTPAAAN
jgi:hypothetical protein